MWLEIDRKIIPKRDPIVEKRSSKLKNSTPQETKDCSENVDGKLIASIQGILKHWKLDSSHFYLHLEDRLRETSTSFNGKILKPLYHISVNIEATPLTLLPKSRTYATDKGVTVTVVPVNSITKFQLATTSTFAALQLTNRSQTILENIPIPKSSILPQLFM